MAKANDKKVVRLTRELLLGTLGNLWESHRERKFPSSRAVFCQNHNLNESNVAFIETGRVTELGFNQLRRYLATTYMRGDARFATSARKVYDGLKELEEFLKEL